MKGKLLNVTASISFLFCVLLANSAGAAGYTLSITTDGSGVVTRNPTNSIYPPGATVTVTALPNDGWYFGQWSGDASGSTNPLNVTMNTNLAITAHFLAFPYTVTLQTNGQGTIALNPAGGSYFSNSLVTATATPATGWVFDSWSGAISSTTNPLLLTVNSNLGLTGTFRQLSANCVLAPSGVVSWWPGEGNAYDASGTNNNGTFVGGVSFAPGKVGQAFSFNPANGTVIVPDSPSLRLTNQLTIEAWINPRTANGDQAIVSKVGGATGNNGYQFAISGNAFFGQFNSPGQSWPSSKVMSSGVIVTGVWTHLAWTYDQSIMKLYLNGQLVASNTIGAKAIVSSSSTLRISGDDNNHVYFDGLIDEPSVYSRALSASEIVAVYNAGSGGKCASPYITAQPQSQVGYGGKSVSFTVAAAGAAPLMYQWQKEASPIAGATGVSLVLTNLQVTEAGNYSVIVTNSFGSTSSSNAYLTVYPAAPTNSATHVVNSPDDASLRAAIALGGWIGFGFNGPITLTNTIPITTNVFLDGSGVAVTISGGNAVRLFSVAPGITFGVTNLTLANGTCLVTNNQKGVTADGGAIYNTGGNVTLVSCDLTNNNALCRPCGGVARGGAIFSGGGTVSLFQTSVSNNLAIAGGQFAPYPSNFINTALGGAIYTANGAVTITGCFISSNLCQALWQGYAPTGYITMGGAAFQASGSMTIERSVFALNQALGGPGGSTLDGYTRPAHGGALAATAGSVTINGSLFLANTAQGGTGSYHSSGGFAYGGAIYSAASLAVRDTALVGNQAAGAVCGAPNPSITPADGYGGAIYNSGTAVLNNCSAYSNSAIGGPGAVSAVYGPVTGGVGSGGAIFNAAQFGATNCTLALNSASGGVGQGYSYFLGTSGDAFGGGVFNSTNATFASMNLTIASNACSSAFGQYFTNGLATGFQIANKSGTLRLHNSLIAYSGTNANAFGTITDDGYNICSDGSAQLFGGASYNFTDPKLGPLGDYGGPTLCMALLPDSPAIDFADPAHSPSADQRGFLRPIGAGPDMGAYEFGSYQQNNPWVSIALTATNVHISFLASPSNLYYLQASTNLVTWTNLSTNGPFAGSTNVSQTFSLQGFKSRYFRLRME